MRTSSDGDELRDFFERRKPKQQEFASYVQRFKKKLKQTVEQLDVEELDRVQGNLVELTSKHRPFLHLNTGLSLLLLALTTEAPQNCYPGARLKVIAYLLANGADIHLTKPELDDAALAEKTNDPEIIELLRWHKQNPDTTFTCAAQRYQLQEKIKYAVNQFQLIKLQSLIEQWISLSDKPEPLNTPLGWYVLHTALSHKLKHDQGSSTLIEFLDLLFAHGTAHQIKEFRPPCRPIDRARAVHQKSHPEIIQYLENALLKVQALAISQAPPTADIAAPPAQSKPFNESASQDKSSPSVIPPLAYRSTSSRTLPESTTSNEQHPELNLPNLPSVIDESAITHRVRDIPLHPLQRQISQANLPLPSKQSIENLLNYGKLQTTAQAAKKESKAWRCQGMCVIS